MRSPREAIERARGESARISGNARRNASSLGGLVIRRFVLARLVLACCLLATPAEAATQASTAAVDSYFPADGLDLSSLLPPPPAPRSVEDRRDLDAVLHEQRVRTPAEIAQARADVRISVDQIARVLGPEVRTERLPAFAALAARVGVDLGATIGRTKATWNRPRPFAADARVRPTIPRPDDPSYPSGHATFAWTTAILLAQMVPERRAEIFARARTFGDERVIDGVHYPSDVEAGRELATAFATRLLAERRFAGDLAAATVEVRAAAGMGPATSKR